MKVRAIVLLLAAFASAMVVARAATGEPDPGVRVVLPHTPSPSPDPTPTPKPEPKREKPSYPPLPPNSGDGRRVVYSNPKQRVWIVDKGQHVIGSWLVSGRENIPSGGNYRVFSRSRYSRSMNGEYKIEYMVRFAHGRSADIGFHSIPVDDNGAPAQSEDELGTYQSRGCVRQKKSDAAKMWDFAQIDTPVIVTY